MNINNIFNVMVFAPPQSRRSTWSGVVADAEFPFGSFLYQNHIDYYIKA